jgi:predicted RNase H-like HicB family nuclease
MKKLIIVIERSRNYFSSYAENVAGVYGGGNTVQEARQSALNAIELLKKHNKPGSIPAILKSKYEVVFRLDLESFFTYYKGIFTKSGLEKITGINQRQLQHYSSGHKKPRPAQKKKIETALHKLGSELLAVELYPR